MVWTLVRYRLVDYKDLHFAEKYTRYQHFIMFISSYKKQQKVLKGCRLKIHSNVAKMEYENTIKKCSLKFTHRTVSNYLTKFLVR